MTGRIEALLTLKLQARQTDDDGLLNEAGVSRSPGVSRNLSGSQWQPCRLPEKSKPWFHLERSGNGNVTPWQTEFCPIQSAAGGPLLECIHSPKSDELKWAVLCQPWCCWSTLHMVRSSTASSRLLPRPIMLQSINSDIFAIFRASWTWFPASSYNSLRDGSNFNKKIIFLSSSRWIFSYASCMALRMAVSPLLCSRLKHLKNDLMICHEICTDIHGTQKMNLKDCSDLPILPLAPHGGSSLWIWVW